MLLTKDKNRVVYIGRLDGQIKYIGRGYIKRAISLLNQDGGHHVESEFDEVEVLGPYSYEESKDMERRLIEDHLPELNNKIKIVAERNKTNVEKFMERKLRQIEREEDHRQFQERQEIKIKRKHYILEQIDKGVGLSKIARDLGVSRQYIHKLKQETK